MWKRRLLDFGNLRSGAGGRHFDRRYFSHRVFNVSGGVFTDRMRLCLLPALERRRNMNIVVWKSPKALRGILRKLFHVKA